MQAFPDGAGDADPLAALRHATASRHAALDSDLPLAGDAAGLDEYLLHLQLLRGWLAPLAAWLDGYRDGPQGAAGLVPLDRLALIEADLADCALADNARIPAAQPSLGRHAPDATAWPAGASAAYRWGICYVIEGSALGGSVLYQRLHEKLAPHPLRYLLGQPGGAGPRWRSFMQALRANVRSEVEIAEACAGACAAFDEILALSSPLRKK